MYPSIFWLKYSLKFTDDNLYKYLLGKLDKSITAISGKWDSLSDDSGNGTNSKEYTKMEVL